MSSAIKTLLFRLIITIVYGCEEVLSDKFCFTSNNQSISWLRIQQDSLAFLQRRLHYFVYYFFGSYYYLHTIFIDFSIQMFNSRQQCLCSSWFGGQCNGSNSRSETVISIEPCWRTQVSTAFPRSKFLGLNSLTLIERF